jgi:hypothetical protein
VGARVCSDGWFGEPLAPLLPRPPPSPPIVRMHRAVYAMGDDVSKLCDAQFESRRLAALGEEDPVVQRALDAGSDRYIKFCLQFVQLLVDAGVTPYLVFDGAALPAKGGTEADRYA